MRQTTWQTAGRPLILGHRGASAKETENTLAAFRRARADGADGVELDVWLCRSGELVVFHDRDLNRLAGRRQRVAELPLAALREIRLTGGGGIPTLSEVIEELGPGMLVNVELKTDAALGNFRLARAVAATAKHHALGARALYSSFHPGALGELRLVAPDLLVGLLFHRGQTRPLRKAWPRLLLRPYALHPEHTLVDGDLARWRRRGYAVVTWTVDDEERVRALAALGVDGIITNDPARARAALRATRPPSG